MLSLGGDNRLMSSKEPFFVGPAHGGSPPTVPDGLLPRRKLKSGKGSTSESASSSRCRDMMVLVYFHCKTEITMSRNQLCYCSSNSSCISENLQRESKLPARPRTTSIKMTVTSLDSNRFHHGREQLPMDPDRRAIISWTFFCTSDDCGAKANVTASALIRLICSSTIRDHSKFHQPFFFFVFLP